MRGKLRNSVRSQSKTRVSSLESLDDSGDINRVWDIIRENTNISAKEVSVVVKRSIISHALMNVQNLSIEGSG
jgi:hypothetical protein